VMRERGYVCVREREIEGIISNSSNGYNSEVKEKFESRRESVCARARERARERDQAKRGRERVCV